MTSEPNITRVDHGKTHGWWVRIYRTEAGKKRCISKLFSDGVAGGKMKARNLARQFRDATLKELRPAVPGGRPRVRIGYGYVKRTERWRRTSYQPVWEAWMRGEGGRAKVTCYSIKPVRQP